MSRPGLAPLCLVAMMLFAACGAPQGSDDVVTEQSNTTEVNSLAMRSRSEGSPRLEVVRPLDSALVESPVTIEIAVTNFNLAASGAVREGEGHVHVVVDGPCVPPGEVMGAGAIHVGDGSTTVDVALDPGEHELCIQLGDGFHTALSISETLMVRVR